MNWAIKSLAREKNSNTYLHTNGMIKTHTDKQTDEQPHRSTHIHTHKDIPPSA